MSSIATVFRIELWLLFAYIQLVPSLLTLALVILPIKGKISRGPRTLPWGSQLATPDVRIASGGRHEIV